MTDYEDGSVFSDTNDIPLKSIITFFKTSNMYGRTKELLKQCLYPHLQDLEEVDWDEVNNGFMAGAVPCRFMRI